MYVPVNIDAVIGAHFPASESDIVSLGDHDVPAADATQYYITLKLYGVKAHGSVDIARDYPYMRNRSVIDSVATRDMMRHIIRESKCDAVICHQLQRLHAAYMDYVRRKRVANITLASPPADVYENPTAVTEYVRHVARMLQDNGVVVPIIRTNACEIPEFKAVKSTSNAEFAKKLLAREVKLCKYMICVERYFGRVAQYINDVLDAM